MPFQNWVFVSHFQSMVSSPVLQSFKNLLSISNVSDIYISHKEFFFEWSENKPSHINYYLFILL